MNNFEKLNMYPHNIEVSQKVKKQFDEGAKTVSIIHATGTGKSYNALYLALEYKNEKIIWLVPNNSIKEHIEKTINDNPNLDIKRDFPNLEIRTYQSLINLTKKELEEIPCDFLIIDEFHHLGAPVWGERVKTFTKSHKDLKVFGMTAYNINYRGTIYERDLTNPETDEIFSDTVESVYDLYDAMIDGILPKPITKSVITEESEIILEIKEKIKVLKRRNDKSYQEYEKMISDVVKIIHKQNGVKELIQQSVKPNGKYIYFCPVFDEEGKNDINTIMETMKDYLQEKHPNQKIVFYKSTSADGEYGKHNRECFYYDKDLDGNDASNAIKIIFVKNQYNEGVHAPNVDGVFLGRKTRSDIVAFEQIGRALSVRGNTHEKIEEYSHYDIETLKDLAIKRGIPIQETDNKNQIIEKLISPTIIDLADNIDFIQELEINLGTRIKEYQQKSSENKRIIKITDSTIEIDVVNKDLFKILEQTRTNLNSKTWNDWYQLALIYYQHYGNSDIPHSFKTINGYEYNENGVALGKWCQNQKSRKDKLTYDRKEKLQAINFNFENKQYKNLEWDKWYQLALIYYKHYGNTEIKYKFKTKNGVDYDEEGYNLGYWCKKQRESIDKLTKERREKLEIIQFRFNNKRSKNTWNDWYNLLEKYYQYYGTSDVPLSFKTTNGIDYDENGYKLGGWVNNVRTNQNKLSQDEKTKLEVIKFRFIKKEKNIISWDEYYKLAEIYYKHYGKKIPYKFKTTNGIDYDESGFNLGLWYKKQLKNIDRLTYDQRKKLELINDPDETIDHNKEWDKKYGLVLKYYQHYGNSEIPYKFKTINGIDYSETGIKLGIWCAEQRNKKDRLSDMQKKKLHDIKFRFETKDNEIRWDEKYNLALKYYQHYGNSEIPGNFKTVNGYEYDENGVALGTWCNEQRRKQEELSKEKREKLKIIKFRFETQDNEIRWEKKYNLALNYYQYYGNLEVPREFKTTNGIDYDEDGVALGNWCHRQKKFQDKLTAEKRKKLELIGFKFENKINRINWDEWYELALKYYKHHGNTEMSHNFKTINGYEPNEKGFSLGSWIYSQRIKQSELTEEQKEKLDLIGFRFIAKKEQNEKITKLCFQYGLNYNKHKYLQNISYQELYAKIMYILEKNYPLEIDGKLNEIFTMSNPHLQMKYNITKEELITKYYINNKERGI